MTQQDYDNLEKQGLAPEAPMVAGRIKENPRVGGLLQDLAGGFKDNAQNGFNVSNLEDNETDYGGKKGLAYHLGEGLGTAGKFMASPAGRAIGTGLLVAATGGNGTQAMTYGLQAGLGNYQNVQQDKMNRNLLQQQGINTENIRGYLNNDMAKSYTDNYYKLNNANYRMGKLSIDQKEHLRKLGYTEAQIAKIEAETDYIQGAKTEKTEADTDLVKEKTKTEPVRREVMKNPPVRKFVSTRNGYTKVDINHNSNTKPKSNPTPQYTEGQTATNPTTGEKMIYKGGKWQKV